MTRRSLVLSLGLLTVVARAMPVAAQTGPTTPYPILFVTQVPIGADFASLVSAFANHKGDANSAPRGGDLWIRYEDGTLRNLTAAAGFGSAAANGLQDVNAIAVRDPAVDWSGTKALFSMVIGAPAQYQVKAYYWQLYEITGFGQGQTPVITKVAHQPTNANNINPTYASDGRIFFVSDRSRNGQAQLYPQLDEYELTASNSGIWSLDPQSGALALLNHAPSGDFTPIVDSYGRVVFTQWDHLQRDQEADADAGLGTGMNCDDGAQFGTFNYADETAGSSYNLNDRGEVFPEARTCRQDLLAGTPLYGHTFNHFFPWAMNQDGTQSEVINHLGRHELHGYIPPARTDDPNIIDYYGQLSRFNPRFISNMFQVAEDPNTPGTYYGIDSPEFTTHASGQVIRISAPPPLDADHIAVDYITHRDTSSTSATANNSGHYRDPLPLSDGTMVVVHDPTQGVETGNGGPATAAYHFRLKTLTTAANGYQTAGQNLTGGISKTVAYYNPDVYITYTGPLWELQPTEVRPRAVPPNTVATLPAVEQSVFDAANVDVATFQSYLAQNGLALLVGRDVTTRDDFDKQQPFNLHVVGGKQTIGKPGTIYDIAYLQLFQADQLRGSTGGYGSITPRAGRRVLAEPLHDAASVANNPAPIGPVGSVTLGTDGSWAAFVPARRAMTWQLTDGGGTGVVRERYWVTFQPGEVRVCASCHGVNQFDQAGHTSPVNAPQALADLLAYWKLVSNGYVPPTPTTTPVGGAATATPSATQPHNSTPTPTPTTNPNNPTPTPSSSPVAIGNCASGIPITASHLGLRLAAGKLQLRGTAVVPKPWSGVDPASNGIHVTVTGLLDAVIPGGSGWTAVGSRWVFNDPLGSHAGIRHVVVRDRSRLQDGRLTFIVRAVNAAPVLPSLDSIQATVTLGSASECAALQWNGPLGARPRCHAGAAMLVCR